MHSLKGIFCALITVFFSFPAGGVSLRVATFNLRLGLESPGTSSHGAAKAVLARIDADVVALQEVFTSDFNSGNPSDLDSLASSLGYPYVFIGAGALDTQSRVVMMSKYPFVGGSTNSIVSPPGANDMTRAAAAVQVDVPGTINDPILITAHLKCCFDLDDPFRRAVEMIRIEKYLAASGFTASDNIFVLGDFNLLGNDQRFSSQPAGLPTSYVLGNDIEFAVQYFADPVDYFTAQGLVNPGYRHQNGTSTNTFIGGSVLDHLLVSPAILARNPRTEIFNSSLEANFPGLPKSGSPLPAGTSAEASDHYAVFGDFELDGGETISLAINPATLSEASPPATVTVTLPSPATEPVVILLSSSDPTEAILENESLVFAVGDTTKATTIIPRRDSILDGPQSLEIRASASGFTGAAQTILITDVDRDFYSLTDLGLAVSDPFEYFSGEMSPSEWTSAGLNWLGPDDGTSDTQGARSYGDGSIGIVTSVPIALTTRVRNDTGASISALEVSYLATQWRGREEGSLDRWEVSMTGPDGVKKLQDLGFTSNNFLPTGALDPPVNQLRRAFLRGLNLESGEEVTLTFTATPGASTGGAASADVFINEFHYDNVGNDEGEFVEIAVGSAYAGELSKVVLYLYNGSNGTIYGNQHPLTTFQEGPVSVSGHRFFWKEISGIQNGSPDGMALVLDGTVKQFLSYEGTFSASGGPANGLTSTPVGVSQTNTTPTGVESLALSGEGSDVDDFSWSIQPGSFTPGQPNRGQSFGASPQPQGIGIDDFSVTALLDRDGDHLPDAEELLIGTDPLKADSDGDGQDDFFESVLALTDPLLGSSNLKINLGVDSSGVVTVSTATLPGRRYQIESSDNFIDWIASEEFEGDGEDWGLVFPEGEKLFFRIRISAP